MADAEIEASPDPALAAWRREVLAAFEARRPPRQRAFATSSGLALPDLFASPATESWDESADIGLPGCYPFTRGVYPNMYRGQLWTMRQYAGYASAEESNDRFRYLLAQGQTGLSVAFDLPTQIGYDPDHRLAIGEVGRVGVSIACLDDMATLFEGIPLERVSTSMTINATAAVLLAMYAALARARGIDPARLRGTIQNDVLKEYVARGTYIFPPSPSMRLVTDAIAFAAASMPLFHAISVSGYHMREAGATAVQEIAFTLANAIAYAMAAIEQGLSADQFLPRLSFFFAAQNDLLEEVAKFRAARWLWAHIARDRLGATDPRSMMLRFHTQTAGVSLTAQQPQNNVVRVALQALAAILGGTQSLHTNSLDEALGLPTPASATLALRTQQILAYESGIADVVDPLAGSYAVESLTCALAQRAQALIVRIDEMGGALAAVDSGWMASQIADSAYQLQREIDEGARVVVGVNRFDTEGGSGQALSVLPIDGNLAQRRAAAIAALRERRDAAGVEGALSAVREAARRDANLLPPLIAAVEARATLGEICDALRAEFGEYRPADAL